jgi:hypothetical protein
MRKGELDIDPRGLIFEAYRMQIGPEECRAIFLDWALGLPEGGGETEVAMLLAHYGAAQPDHPMTAVLREGVAAAASCGCPCGSWRGRTSRWASGCCRRRGRSPRGASPSRGCGGSG